MRHAIYFLVVVVLFPIGVFTSTCAMIDDVLDEFVCRIRDWSMGA